MSAANNRVWKHPQHNTREDRLRATAAYIATAVLRGEGMTPKAFADHLTKQIEDGRVPYVRYNHKDRT